MRCLHSVAVPLLLAARICLAQSQDVQPCNGHVELCSRAYSNVSYACTHNAYSYPPPNDVFVVNQRRPIKQQLEDGVRALMLDVVRPGVSSTKGGNLLDTIISWFSKKPSGDGAADPLDSVHLCHGSCDYIDKGKLVDALVVIREFLDANPREVVTLIVENVSGFSAQDLRPSFEAAGASKYAFVPEFSPSPAQNGYPWPTLSQMIDKNQRLVVFIDDKADPSQVPYILPEWGYVVEIPYANIAPVAAFPCNQDRPKDGIPRDLIVMNHFAYNRVSIGKENIDTPLSAGQIKSAGYNSVDSLAAHVNTCRATWGDRVLNFVTLDYYDVGDGAIFKIVDQINGVAT
ncbi:hypothetical protein IWQ57_000038 [Coemansia nantahalensis]|uniref:Uncharacterized protein n=2 Tax=Coemansia TaxID=4863 RepID=A0ACC1L6F1_9FUNG|nr:hypothetical protein IWQ57_000038 [Coemansia nantahalensis]KAJ2802363.1 hypothetical protein H4R21_002447 [Coemansia helicoidea]